jgi:hypothetical protein
MLAGREHLDIQTSGYTEVDLNVALPLLRDLTGTFDLGFIGPVTDHDLRAKNYFAFFAFFSSIVASWSFGYSCSAASNSRTALGYCFIVM